MVRSVLRVLPGTIPRPSRVTFVTRRSDDLMKRRSLHVEPHGLLEIARHYVRELIYGANDGIITTFAVVAGVAGGGLALPVVLILGAANLFADGLSMAAGNYFMIPARQ